MKTTLKLILLSFILLSIQSCYKRKDTETIKGTITCIDTVNNVGVSGIKYTIYERKYIKKAFEDIVYIEGETNQNGKAFFEFERPKNKKKWGYFIKYDENTFPNNLEYDKSNLNFKPNAGSNSFYLYNIYNEYDNNDLTINFYP